MGIAESISAVGVAGTVTGLSYTQATAQQHEDEEEAKRKTEAENAAAQDANTGKGGPDENGPSKGLFPASGNLGARGGGGGGRGQGPGTGVEAGTSNAKQARSGRPAGGGRSSGGGIKQMQPLSQPLNRSDKERKPKQKKKNTKGGDQPAVESGAVTSDIPEGDPSNPITSAAQSPVPGSGKSRRRSAGHRRDMSRALLQTGDASNHSAPGPMMNTSSSRPPSSASHPRAQGHAAGAKPQQIDAVVTPTAVENSPEGIPVAKPPTSKPSDNRGGRGRGGRPSRAHIERSRPLVASTQSNRVQVMKELPTE
ncbi:hypothetical protein D9757_003130 [Collybiopsis confluens]|uniref:Uncharacterized protein n=1 Tax=Collybiopsis confluens TaxID=2823264 RepID=A0A8H5HX58_9AGAR|nr:hypothetical protein D9757_003130 [Collybiopsis confluens]